MKYKPREYQLIDYEKIRTAYKAGARSVIHVSPTGSGKTQVIGMICESAYMKKKSVLLLAHRNTILRQIHKKLKEFEIYHGIIAPGYPHLNYRIQVASVHTMIKRLKKYSRDTFSLIIIDEAHHIAANTWKTITEYFYTAKLYGATATPIRLDMQGLGNFFETMVIGPSYQYLCDMGFLSKPYYKIPDHIDLSDIKSTMGDWNKKQLNQKMDKRCITGNAIEFYKKYADKKPALGFCVSINHAEHVAEQFVKAGYKSKIIHSKLNETQNIKTIEELKNGVIDIVFSCDKIGEGADIPNVEAIILLRPTQSLTINHQQVGRGSRIMPGKDKFVVIDSAGNCEYHGLIYWPIKWKLTTTKFQPKIKAVKICQYCFAPYYANLSKCPDCGMSNKSNGKRKTEPIVRKGNLKEIDYRTLNQEIRNADNIVDLKKIGDKMNYNSNWAYHMWRQRELWENE